MWTIVKKESLENLLTLRFVIGFLACNIVFGLMSYVLVQDFLHEWNGMQSAEYDNEQEMASMEVYSFVRPSIIREPSLLAVFGTDMGKQWGKRVWISHTRIPVFTTDEATSGSSGDFLGFFSSFDFINVVQIFISLLALLFSFNAISGEKERGTLRLVLSNPAGRTGIFIGKYLGSLLALAPIVVSSMAVAFVVFMVNTPAPLSADDWASAGIILFVTLLLGAAFAAVGMLVSSLTHRTASSLIICMIVWVVLVLVLPSSVGFVSSELGFSEDARDYNRNLQALYGEYNDEMNQVRYYARDYFLMSNVNRSSEGRIICRMIGDNARNFLMTLLPKAISAQNEFASRRFGLESEYFASRKAKTELTENLMRISPSSLFGNIVNALTRTDAAGHESFIEQARNYRQEVVEYIESHGGYTSSRWFTNDVEDAPYREMVRFAEMMTLPEMGAAFQDPELVQEIFTAIEEAIADPARKLDLSDLPRFQMRQQPLAEALGAAALDIILLSVFIAVIVVVSYTRFFSYDPR